VDEVRPGVILEHVRKLSAQTEEGIGDRELLQRFACQLDQTAFASLVRRHGPMVFQACRRLLHDWHDAEDVCQAVFLVLASKAGLGHWRESVPNWLYRVAYYLSLKAKRAAARRNRHESQVNHPPAPADPVGELTGQELQAALDEALARLPEKYRAPLVLCYLDSLLWRPRRSWRC
jgi:RNA polymerase sigma factor (sigma-70 family)